LGKLFTYNRKEKLKRKKMLDQLFAGKQTVSQFPVRIFFTQHAIHPTAPVQAGVGCSSRTFKKAVHRNRIKRLLREAWRLNKAPIYELAQNQNKGISLFILYTGKELPQQQELLQVLPFLLQKMAQQLNNVNHA
jgi:ribonuclease P protein component